MFRLDLHVDVRLLAALQDPGAEIRNMLAGLFLDVDAMQFGPQGDLDRTMRAGARGGGPHGWKPLSEKYLEWKAKQVRRRGAVAELLERAADVSKPGQRRVAGSLKAGLRDEFRAQLRALRFSNRAAAQRWLRRGEVISTDIWVKSGATRDRVVRAMLRRSARGGGSGGRTVTGGGKTGLRRIRMKVTPHGGSYGVEIDKKIAYAGATGSRGKRRWPGDIRPLFEWTPAAKEKARALAQRHMRAIGLDITGQGRSRSRMAA